MLPYIIAYLALGAIISLAHPWIRGGLADLWRSEATGAEIVLKPILGCVAFVISCVVWPIGLRSAYKAGRVPKNLFDRLLNDPTIRKDSLFHTMLQLSADGTDADEIPGAIGEFGLVATNPIPTANMIASKSYLDRLATSDGQRVSYERRGSVRAEGVKKPVDVYELFSLEGHLVATVYISPYHRKTSDKVPKGLSIHSHVQQ